MSSTRELEIVIDEYLAGRLGFWSFYSTFMDLWNSASLPDNAIDLWDDFYDLIYMAGPDPVSAEDQSLGIVGDAELKQRLTELRRKIG